MSNLREDVARAIYNCGEYRTYDTIAASFKDDYREMADAAIAAALPHIERELIEQLAKEAEKGIVRSFRDPNDARIQTRRNIGLAAAEWLRTKGECVMTLRGDVLRAVANADGNLWPPAHSVDAERYCETADAAIAATRPHIERELIERLAKEAEISGLVIYERYVAEDISPTYGDGIDVAEWLRTYLPAEGGDKTT